MSSLAFSFPSGNGLSFSSPTANIGSPPRISGKPGGGGGGGGDDIVADYRWTISPIDNPDDVPSITLEEHSIDQTLLAKNLQYYASAIASFGKGGQGLEVYKELWPDNPTGNNYNFPYFNKTAFEVTTPMWDKIDDIGEALNGMKNTANSISSTLKGSNNSILGKLAGGISAVTNIGDIAAKTASIALKASNPVVNMVDRPRVFSTHNERTLTIQFPLYNTHDSGDWQQNSKFWKKFAKANLYNKTSVVTGLPPCFYRVTVNGQYFSYASCVTNFSVENLGNIRNHSNEVIPDAYQISISVTEMLMPSLNQFSEQA